MAPRTRVSARAPGPLHPSPGPAGRSGGAGAVAVSSLCEPVTVVRGLRGWRLRAMAEPLVPEDGSLNRQLLAAAEEGVAHHE